MACWIARHARGHVRRDRRRLYHRTHVGAHRRIDTTAAARGARRPRCCRDARRGDPREPAFAPAIARARVRSSQRLVVANDLAPYSVAVDAAPQLDVPLSSQRTSSTWTSSTSPTRATRHRSVPHGGGRSAMARNSTSAFPTARPSRSWSRRCGPSMSQAGFRTTPSASAFAAGARGRRCAGAYRRRYRSTSATLPRVTPIRSHVSSQATPSFRRRRSIASATTTPTPRRVRSR
jgi:hypothetical protein